MQIVFMGSFDIELYKHGIFTSMPIDSETINNSKISSLVVALPIRVASTDRLTNSKDISGTFIRISSEI